VFKDNYVVELEDVKMVDLVYDELSQEKSVFSLINAKGKLTEMSNKAQKFLAHEAIMVPRIKGVVLVLYNLPVR
jgi:hypothetical protein